jgi:transcription elongation GreA/GreB family factor
MADVKYFTKEALEKLKKQLDHLTRVERPGISNQIAEARDKGDLSENADLKKGKISVDSPIARGLLGHEIGDEVEIEVPAGKLPFKIIDIQY